MGKHADGHLNGGSLKIKVMDDLRRDSQTNNEDIVEEIKKREDTKKGSAVLVEYISDHIKSQYHVLKQGDEIYDATLNQTNIGGNDNKFYIIKALESNDGSTFMVYNEWGRVGMQGRHKLHGPYTGVQSAIYEFEKKFLDKTNNSWSNRKQFVSQPGFYTWFEMNNGTGEEIDVQGNLKRKPEVQVLETKLEKPVAEFISLICNASMMENQMNEIVQCTIDTPQKQKRKLEMVEALGEIEVAKKLLDPAVMEEDRLLSRYESLHCDLTPIEVNSKEFHMIKKYMKNSHAETHSHYTAEIVQIFRASRHGEADSFSEHLAPCLLLPNVENDTKNVFIEQSNPCRLSIRILNKTHEQFSNTKNRMLLWHGSPLTNWVGILSKGLRLPPPKAPGEKGHMFGKGIYFADMFSKSARHCRASQQAPDSVLLLCEVALGEMAELLTANHDADKLPQGKLSTKGVGSTAPDMLMMETLEDGVVVPLGHPKKQPRPQPKLLHNEYIAYNVNQIRMRYVVHVNFNFKKHVPLDMED